MKKIKKFIPLLAAITLITSCQKVIEPKDLPQQDPRLVLNCIVYNDSIVKANVSSSKSILSGKDYKMIDDATCDLYLNGSYVERLVNIKNGNYIAKFRAVANNNYTIKVSAKGFTDVEGTCNLPKAALDPRWERYDTVNSTFSKYKSYGGQGANLYSYGSGSVKFRLYLKDDPDIANFYSLQAYTVLFDSLGRAITAPEIGYISFNSDSNNNPNAYNSGGGIETDDKVIVNGHEVLLDANVSGNLNGALMDAASSVGIVLVLAATSEDMFKYKVTLDKQRGVGIGLFAEPVQVHNNITNGMGIVGGINYRTVFMGRYPIIER